MAHNPTPPHTNPKEVPTPDNQHSYEKDEHLPPPQDSTTSESNASPASSTGVRVEVVNAAKRKIHESQKEEVNPAQDNPQEKTPRLEQKNRRRCWKCRGKIGLIPITCRCGYSFCSKHRYAEAHDCSFNFKADGRKRIQETNPRVRPVKLARIN